MAFKKQYDKWQPFLLHAQIARIVSSFRPENDSKNIDLTFNVTPNKIVRYS